MNEATHNKEPCIYCGALRKSNCKIHDVWMCRRHYEQLKKYGRLIDNNPQSLSDKNHIRIYEDHAEIELRNKYHEVVGYALIDLDDVDRCSLHKWYLDSVGYARTSIDKNKIRLHKLITNTDKETIVDHINRNKLDCRKVNLRIVDASMNSFNRDVQSNNKCGVKGVYQNQAGYWYAKMQIRDIDLCKTFPTKEDAIKQRKEWEKKYNMEVET